MSNTRGRSRELSIPQIFHLSMVSYYGTINTAICPVGDLSRLSSKKLPCLQVRGVMRLRGEKSPFYSSILGKLELEKSLQIIIHIQSYLLLVPHHLLEAVYPITQQHFQHGHQGKLLNLLPAYPCLPYQLF